MRWWNHRVRPSGASVTITRVSTRQPYATKQTSVLQGRLQSLPSLHRADASPSPAPAAHGARGLPLPESLLTHFAWPSGQCQCAWRCKHSSTCRARLFLFFSICPLFSSSGAEGFFNANAVWICFYFMRRLLTSLFHIVLVGSVELWTWVPFIWALVITVWCTPKQLFQPRSIPSAASMMLCWSKPASLPSQDVAWKFVQRCHRARLSLAQMIIVIMTKCKFSLVHFE